MAYHNKHLFSHNFCVWGILGRLFEASQVWLKVSNEIAAKLLPGTVILSEGSTGWAGSTESAFKFTHSGYWQASEDPIPGWLMRLLAGFSFSWAIGLDACLPCYATRALHRAAHNMAMATCFLQQECRGRERERERERERARMKPRENSSSYCNLT